MMKRSIIQNPFKRTTTRTALSVIFLFVILLVLLFYLSQNYRSNLINFRKSELKRQVEISLNTIQPIIEEYRAGKLSRDDALKQSVNLVRRMTYNSETMQNYIFMSSYSGFMLVQPLEPWKQDTYQLDSKDSYGNYYIRDLIQTARSSAGEGYVSYFYPPPGADTPGEKLSYVKGIPELECYIGTGMFFDDIDNLYKEYLLSPLVIILIGFTSIYILIIIYIRPLLRCFRLLLNLFHKISLAPDIIPIVPKEAFSEDSDEYEILTGFDNMVKTVGESRAKLKSSEKRYRYLYEESSGVRLTIDLAGMITEANSSFLRTMGYSHEAFESRSFSDILNPGQEDKIRRIMSDAAAGECTEALDFDLKDSEGNNRTILISEVLEIPEDKSKTLMTGVDITNRKIAERKAALQKEQLIQADKLASIGVLVSGVAHEINNPNQFILSNAGLLEDVWRDCVPVLDEYYDDNGDFLIYGVKYSEIRDQVPEYLQGITEGARRIGKIVSDLKTLSKNDSNRPWSSISINEILESAVNLCSNMIKKGTDNFDLKLEKDLPRVFGNFQQLEQVFINLIQNAVQALTDHKELLSISSSSDERGRVHVVVEDQGCGIKREDLTKIFDPFYTTKRESGGTGIGLSISKNIIDEHKGNMIYTSEYKKGTTVRIILNPVDTEGEHCAELS